MVYNTNMTNKNRYAAPVLCVILLASCVGAPYTEPTQLSRQDYAVTVLFNSEMPDSPRLEVALSLLQMNYPEHQAEFLHETLYSQKSPQAYKDRIEREQGENYRRELSTYEGAGSNWQYMESFTARNTEYERLMSRGIVAERELYVYTGGANGLQTKRYYVIDLDSLRLVTIDDMFENYHDDRIRAIVYKGLRNYSGLADNQPLSHGIFFSDEPELSNNFFVSQEGIGLCWDPIEIAPHYAGSIEIIVPWRDIRPMLKHSGMELMTKFNIYLFM